MVAAGLSLPHGAIFGLALTQIVGWGTTYYVPSVLAPKLGAALGLPQELIFGGITIMLLVSAGAAPVTSRLIERRGPRPVLMLGSTLLGLSLLILSGAQGAWSYTLAWTVAGLATPAAMTQGAFAALAHIAGLRARQAIGQLLLITAFAATIS